MTFIMTDPAINGLMLPLLVSGVTVGIAGFAHAICRVFGEKQDEARVSALPFWEDHYRALEALAADTDTPAELLELAVWFARRYKDRRFALVHLQVDEDRANQSARYGNEKPEPADNPLFDDVLKAGFKTIDRMMGDGQIVPIQRFLEVTKTGVAAMNAEFSWLREKPIPHGRNSEDRGTMIVVRYVRERVQGIQNNGFRVARQRR